MASVTVTIPLVTSSSSQWTFIQLQSPSSHLALGPVLSVDGATPLFMIRFLLLPPDGRVSIQLGLNITDTLSVAGQTSLMRWSRTVQLPLWLVTEKHSSFLVYPTLLSHIFGPHQTRLRLLHLQIICLD